MPDGRDATTVRVLASIRDVAAGEWDACAGLADPFTRHAFLAALEDSGSVGPRAGWASCHLGAFEGERLLAAAPLYLKSHSYGEYVFDWAWAEAYERAGGRYYPKLQSCVPFTPATGRRFLLREGAPAELADALARAMTELAADQGASSVHVTFPTRPEWERLGGLGYLQRIGQQFHWENRGYGEFDDFLAALASRKRKAIRKERRAVAEAGIDMRVLVGGDIEKRHWDAFYRFYVDTSSRKWGHQYLNRGFFKHLDAGLAERVVLVLALRGTEPVAGALNLLGEDTLYGRYWGCTETHAFLHFETCYYQAIDFAIARGLKRVEAGAQGPHKVQRGYLPAATYSAHWIADQGLKRAIGDFVVRERRSIEAEMAAVSAEHSPYRQDEA